VPQPSAGELRAAAAMRAAAAFVLFGQPHRLLTPAARLQAACMQHSCNWTAAWRERRPAPAQIGWEGALTRSCPHRAAVWTATGRPASVHMHRAAAYPPALSAHLLEGAVAEKEELRSPSSACLNAGRAYWGQQRAGERDGVGLFSCVFRTALPAAPARQWRKKRTATRATKL
jgi:hypothetical protein